MGCSKGHWKIRHPVAHTGWLNRKVDGEFWCLGKPNTNSLRLSDLHEWRWDNQVGLGLRWRSSPHVRQEFEYPNLKEGRIPLPFYCRCVFSGSYSGVHWQPEVWLWEPTYYLYWMGIHLTPECCETTELALSFLKGVSHSERKQRRINS